ELCPSVGGRSAESRGGSPRDGPAMNTVVLIPDGVGVRNFILGPFLSQLQCHGTVTVVHDLPGSIADQFRDSRRSYPQMSQMGADGQGKGGSDHSFPFPLSASSASSADEVGKSEIVEWRA